MPCHCERLKVRLTMVPLNAALAAKLRVSRSGVVSGRNEQRHPWAWRGHLVERGFEKLPDLDDARR